MTYSVWMQLPTQGGKTPFTRLMGELTKDEAEWVVEHLYFPARSMPDEKEAR